MVAILERPKQKLSPQKLSPAIPPLAAGDRLTSDEFLRRYNAMPHINKAELIEGVVYMPSPVRHREHGRPHGFIMGWLSTYFAATPGTDFSDNATVLLDIDNDPQPDALLRIETEAGGTSVITDNGYLEGPPELLVEISASTESYDLHDKMNSYRRNGVQEYVVWRVRNNAIDWFHLTGGRYERLTADADGVIHSRVFPGLRLDTVAMLADDLATVLTALQNGLQTAEHAEFVQTLRQRMAQA